MTKLEGSLDQFLAGRRDRDAAETPTAPVRHQPSQQSRPRRLVLSPRVPPAGGGGAQRLRWQLIARPPAAPACQPGGRDGQPHRRDRSLSFTFLRGEVTHPLTTWVDCGVREGERAEVGITGVTPPNRYSGRVFADP